MNKETQLRKLIREMVLNEISRNSAQLKNQIIANKFENRITKLSSIDSIDMTPVEYLGHAGLNLNFNYTKSIVGRNGKTYAIEPSKSFSKIKKQLDTLLDSLDISLMYFNIPKKVKIKDKNGESHKVLKYTFIDCLLYFPREGTDWE